VGASPRAGFFACTSKGKKIALSIVAATAIAVAALGSSGSPAEAHYWHRGYHGGGGYYRGSGDAAGAAIALGLMGAFAGAAIASQGGYGYAYTPYYYQPACNPGFYWTGDTCWPY
jgi:hypothetical protein